LYTKVEERKLSLSLKVIYVEKERKNSATVVLSLFKLFFVCGIVLLVLDKVLSKHVLQT